MYTVNRFFPCNRTKLLQKLARYTDRALANNNIELPRKNSARLRQSTKKTNKHNRLPKERSGLSSCTASNKGIESDLLVWGQFSELQSETFNMYIAKR